MATCTITIEDEDIEKEILSVNVVFEPEPKADCKPEDLTQAQRLGAYVNSCIQQILTTEEENHD